MSDRERSRSRNGSRGAKEPVKMSRPHSRSRSHSPQHKTHKKYSGSPSPARGSKTGYRGAGSAGGRYRSRSRSPSPKRAHRRYSRSRSRSYNNYRRSSHSHSPMSSRRRHQGDRIAGEVGEAPAWKAERQRSPDGNKRKPYSSQSSRFRNIEEAPTQSRCLGVFGLSIYTTEAQINHIFSKYGPVERVQVVIDAKTGRSRGFCFVYYEAVEDAKAAKDQCTGMEIDGRRIRVDFSITQRAHTPTPGIYMGKPTFFSRDNGGYDRRRDRESDYYGGRGGGYRDSRGGGDYRYKHSPSPYRRAPSRRYERERSYSPRRY